MIGAVVAGYGSSLTAHRTLASSLDRYKEIFRSQPQVAREIEHFKANIGSVRTPDDLVDDPRLFRFALGAYALESQNFAHAFMKKVFREGADDAKDFARQMVDPRYAEIARAFSFQGDGPERFKAASWVNNIVERYVTNEFERAVGETNPNLRLALYFKRKAPFALSWLNVLGDKALNEVARKAVGLPPATAQIDLDKQIALFEERASLADFRNPQKLERFVDRFLARADAETPAAAPIVPLVAPAARPLSGFAPIVTIDPTLLLKS